MTPPPVAHRLPAILGFALCAAAQAVGSAPAKSRYTFADPTPNALLRELTTDRPDVTESPFTVDAGHVQLEMDFANFTRNRTTGTRTTGWGVVPFNLRLGLLNNLEAGIFVAPYIHHAEAPRGGPREVQAGFGGVTLRAKVNFRGNDGGATAFGIIADLTLPTVAAGLGGDRTEGQLMLPVAFDLPGGWDGGVMTAVESRHRDGGGYRAVWNNTMTLGHNLAKDLSGYAELTSSASEGTHVATADFGLAWKLDGNTQLDAGANLGLSRGADDLLVFAGISRRF
jgi:hypothetical protein